MKSGINVDCKYIIRVSKLMENLELPRPKNKSKFIVNDREFLPIVTVECEI